MEPILADAALRGAGHALDALAYLDEELSPAEREAADALVAQEMAAMALEQPQLLRPDGAAALYLAGTRLAAAPPPPASPLVSEALEQLRLQAAAGGTAAAAAAPRLDARRLETPDAAPAGDDAAAWEAGVARAQLTLEAQEVRAINLELFARFGVDAWRAATAEADAGVAAARARVQLLRAHIEALNAARRAAQEGAMGGSGGAGAASGVGAGAGQSAPGARLKLLARKAAQIAASNFETQVACSEAAAQVKRLRRAVADGQQGSEGAGAMQ